MNCEGTRLPVAGKITSRLINVRRLFVCTAKGVQAADEMLRIANNLQRDSAEVVSASSSEEQPPPRLWGLKRAHAHVSLRAGSKLAQMAYRCIGIVLLIALATVPAIAAGTGNGTIITLPRDVEWIRDTSKNGPHGSYYAYLRGKRGDDCDWLRINKFPSGYEYPMHVNHAYWLFAILSGTLVLGFDRQHRKSGERFLPAGTIMQGLAAEPHYGRAIGETIFEIYAPCLKR